MLDVTSNTAAALEEFEAEMPMTEGVQMLSLDDLRESPTNPRKTFAKLEDLAASMKGVGVLQSLLVRPWPNGDGFEVVAGARRFRAAKLAGLEEVPCDVRELSDAQVLEVQLTENLQRADLLPIEEAEGYEALRARGWSVEQIAGKTGRSRETIYGRLKLLALGPEGRKALAEGVLVASVAVRLARIPSHEMQAQALRDLFADGEQPSRWALEKLTNDYVRALRTAPFDIKDDMLCEATPACAKCPKNSRNATPGLFDDLPKNGGDLCTDVDCFAKKSAAAWNSLATLEQAKGTHVLTPAEGLAIFKGTDSVSWDSSWVELDGPCHSDAKQRTWRELLEKVPADVRPEEVMAPDAKLVPHRLVDRKAATKAIGEATGAKWAEGETDKAKAERKKAKKAAKTEKSERELDGLVLTDLAKRLGAEAKKVGLSDEEWEALALMVCDCLKHSDRMFEALEVKSFDALEKDIRRSSAQEIRSHLAIMTAFYQSGEEEELTPEVLKLAKARGIKVDALRLARETAAQAEAELDAKKTKKAGKSKD